LNYFRDFWVFLDADDLVEQFFALESWFLSPAAPHFKDVLGLLGRLNFS
jgi:hypothetical protein